MQTIQRRWTWGWGWLLVVVISGLFLRWAALSCYNDSIDSKGPGGMFPWIVSAIFYGLSYTALLPAYVWLISPRPWWGLALVLALVALSCGLLREYTTEGLAGGNDSDRAYAFWDSWQAWPFHPAAYGPWHLLLSIVLTLLGLLLGAGLQLWLRRQRPGPQ